MIRKLIRDLSLKLTKRLGVFKKELLMGHNYIEKFNTLKTNTVNFRFDWDRL